MVIHFRNLLTSINQQQVQVTNIFEDNQGAVSLSKGSKINARTKHIDIKFHHMRSLVAKGVVDVKYIETNLQRADILTKSLGAVKFLKNPFCCLECEHPTVDGA